MYYKNGLFCFWVSFKGPVYFWTHILMPRTTAYGLWFHTRETARILIWLSIRALWHLQPWPDVIRMVTSTISKEEFCLHCCHNFEWYWRKISQRIPPQGLTHTHTDTVLHFPFVKLWLQGCSPVKEAYHSSRADRTARPEQVIWCSLGWRLWVHLALLQTKHSGMWMASTPSKQISPARSPNLWMETMRAPQGQ